MAKIKIEFPSEFTFVRGIRVCISGIAYNFGFSDREVYQIETIVDEVCNNAIEYGGAKDKRTLKNKDVIKVECNFKIGKLELVVTDKGGQGFNLKEILERNRRLAGDSLIANNLDKRGRGLVIVQRFVDELDIDTSKDGTAVKVVKRVGRD